MRITYKAIKPLCQEQSKALADIKAHTNEVYNADAEEPCGAAQLFRYGDFHRKHRFDKMQEANASDAMTVGHETTHQINNEMANANGGRGKFVGLYGLNDVGFVIAEPKVTISQVAQQVPQGFRGGVCGVYDLYMVSQAKDWGDSPLYICDEWVAYTNGATVALELAQAGDSDPNRWSELQNAIYFDMFAATLWHVLGGDNPEVLDLLMFQFNRVGELYAASQKCSSLVREDTTKLLKEFVEHEFYQPFKGGGGKKLPDFGTEEYL